MPGVNVENNDSWVKNIDGIDVHFFISTVSNQTITEYKVNYSETEKVPLFLLPSVAKSPTRNEVEEAYKNRHKN